MLAERLQLDSTKNSVSEIEVTEVKPAVFQQIIGTHSMRVVKIKTGFRFYIFWRDSHGG